MAASASDIIRRSYRGDVAHQHVVAISQHHRIQASPGYRAAAAYVTEVLRAEGLEAEIRHYPADRQSSFWSAPSFQEWVCEGPAWSSSTDREKWSSACVISPGCPPA